MCDTYYDIAYGMLSIIFYILSLYLSFDTGIHILTSLYQYIVEYSPHMIEVPAMYIKLDYIEKKYLSMYLIWLLSLLYEFRVTSVTGTEKSKSSRVFQNDITRCFTVEIIFVQNIKTCDGL